MLPKGGPAVTDAEGNVRVERWKARLEFAPETDREKALAEDAVTQGAHADLFRLQLVRSGYTETPTADAMRREAVSMLKDYGALRQTPQDEAEMPSGYSGIMSW